MELTEKPQSGHEYAETLLAAANKEQRGKLTVFLGAAAGVGKTCSMLQEAHARLLSRHWITVSRRRRKTELFPQRWSQQYSQ